MEEAFQLLCTVEKGGAQCAVTFCTAALPCPLLQHMGWLGGSSTCTAAPPPRRCGRKDPSREAALIGDKQTSICVFYRPLRKKHAAAPAKLLCNRAFRAGTILMRRPVMRSGATRQRNQISLGDLCLHRSQPKPRFSKQAWLGQHSAGLFRV